MGIFLSYQTPLFWFGPAYYLSAGTHVDCRGIIQLCLQSYSCMHAFAFAFPFAFVIMTSHRFPFPMRRICCCQTGALGCLDMRNMVLSISGILYVSAFQALDRTIPWLWQASHQLICCATISFWYMAWLQCRVDQADTPWDTVVSGFTDAVSCPVLTACFYLVLPCLVLFYLIMVAKM